MFSEEKALSYFSNWILRIYDQELLWKLIILQPVS